LTVTGVVEALDRATVNPMLAVPVLPSDMLASLIETVGTFRHRHDAAAFAVRPDAAKLKELIRFRIAMLNRPVSALTRFRDDAATVARAAAGTAAMALAAGLTFAAVASRTAAVATGATDEAVGTSAATAAEVNFLFSGSALAAEGIAVLPAGADTSDFSGRGTAAVLTLGTAACDLGDR
jgi:hypothetical protein